jgi:hypothetical protein
MRRPCRLCGLMRYPLPGEKIARIRLGGAYKPGMVTGALDVLQTQGARAGRLGAAGRVLRSWTRAREDLASGSRR